MQMQMDLKEIEEISESTFGKLTPVWKLRRVVDSLENRGLLNVQRLSAGMRIIAYTDLHTIGDELRRIGWLPAGEPDSC